MSGGKPKSSGTAAAVIRCSSGAHAPLLRRDRGANAAEQIKTPHGMLSMTILAIFLDLVRTIEETPNDET
jgi:hypothetical protein